MNSFNVVVGEESRITTAHLYTNRAAQAKKTNAPYQRPTKFPALLLLVTILDTTWASPLSCIKLPAL